MRNFLTCFAMAATAAFAQYKMEPVGPPPSDMAPAFASEMQAQGYKISSDNGTVWCEIWLRKTVPSGPKSAEDAVALPTIPQGALLGVVRFPGPAADRRGQTIKPGIYTLRYSIYPVTGDHQGVAPNRDFALLVPAAEDKDPAATPNFEALVALSRKASGTPHPAVLNIWNSTSDKLPSLEKQGDHDWVLNAKLGDQPFAIILIGKVES